MRKTKSYAVRMAFEPPNIQATLYTLFITYDSAAGCATTYADLHQDLCRLVLLAIRQHNGLGFDALRATLERCSTPAQQAQDILKVCNSGLQLLSL